MKYKVISTGEVILADLAFVQQHHAGDFDEVMEAPEASARRELTHLGFRRLFSQDERELADELEVTFETNPALTTEQKRMLRSGYKDFYAGSSVDRDDPTVLLMLTLFETLGIIRVGRAMEMLA